jgi:hypothetical protein
MTDKHMTDNQNPTTPTAKSMKATDVLRRFRANTIPETMDHSYFPITVQWQDTMEEEVIQHPSDLTSGRGFKVIKVQGKPQ